jgi:predicted RNase H-like nuclease (RuvC/YqgF family)
MVDLLTEMLIASGGENIKNLNLQRKVNYFPLVFEKYDIDSTRFKESNYYYTSRIDDYDEILGKVDARLKALEKRYKEERKISDSIKRMQRDSLRLNKKLIRERRPDFDLEYEE